MKKTLYLGMRNEPLDDEQGKGEALSYKVYEDNGGGLHLAVFDGDGVQTYHHSGYEYNPGQLIEDLEALKQGDNPAEDWDGNELEHAINEDMPGVELIADSDGVYYDKMGAAGHLEFDNK